MPSLRRTLATSKHPAVALARRVYHGIDKVSVPVPALIIRPVFAAYFGLRWATKLLRRILLAEPYFKSKCARFGRNLHTGHRLHYIAGKGSIVLGDDVLFDGVSGIIFAARFRDNPTLEVGDGTDFAHGCTLTIADRITIGSRCMVATGTWIFDSPGHPADPSARLAGLPPSADDVRPVTIGDNVWIGRNCTIYPGVTIGDGSILSAGSVVVGDIPAYTVVAGNPARRIAALKPPAADTAVDDAKAGGDSPAEPRAPARAEALRVPGEA